MKELSKNNKIVIAIVIFAAFLISLPFVIYLKVLPYAVSNDRVLEYVQKMVKESVKTDLIVKNPVLKTNLTPEITFKVDEISLEKDKKNLFSIKKLDTSVSFAKIMQKKVVLKNFGVEDIYADVNKLMALGGEPKEEAKPFDMNGWSLSWFDSLLYIKNCIIVYDLDKDTHLKIAGKNMEITSTRNPKYVSFDIKADVAKKTKGRTEIVKFAISDNNTVYIKDKKLFIDKGILGINNSKVFINACSDQKNNFDLTVFSHKFDMENVVELMNTNLVVPGGDEIMAFFKDIKGSFNFQINMTNKGMKGIVKLNPATLKLVPLANLPVYLDKGFIDITDKVITLHDFDGWYGSSKTANKVKLAGTVEDYTKSVDTNIEITGSATNDLMKNYISKLVGFPITLTGPCGAKAVVKSKYNKMDFAIMGKVPTGQDILLDGASLSPVGYDRAFKADMHLEGTLLNIKSINYYIAKEINNDSKGKIKPIVTVDGNMDIATLEVKNLGFEIPKPLPSEFLNVLIGQKVFKKGTISGHMQYLNDKGKPRLDGTLAMEKVRIPSQRLSIKDAKLNTDKNIIHIDAFGRFKKSDYKFKGSIQNSLLFPVVIKDIRLTVDNIDVDRIMQSMNQQNTDAVAKPIVQDTSAEQKIESAALVSAEKTSDEENDELYTFDTGLLIVEKCALEVVKGFYKDIKFGNLIADLTLDKNGLLQIHSNKFDFAEGISTLKVVCDLMKHEYSIRLGVKDINSDLIAGTLLALPREITGKARGLIELNTDDSLQLNGRIRFDIKDGTIQKVGLVEYALKFASLFRNPMAMISPSTIIDLVNVPDGKFNKINGDMVIKDNVIEKMMIKSSAPQLSSFIIGRYDLVSGDAILRIYTKFSNKNKGVAGFMRNLSLNSLANRVPLSSRNDSLYYSAELSQLPPLEADEKDCQVFLTKVDGDVQNFNFLSSLKKIK